MSNVVMNMHRNVWCVLGLPFDALDMAATVDEIHIASVEKTPLFLSTPNLNFLIASQKDIAFKNSVINSDLSVADGKYLVWVARLLGVPISERVAGSDLIEILIKNDKKHPPLKVFFFGGQEGVAEIACKKLNIEASGLECVGYFNPGFGSLDAMSEDGIINTINRSNADFVIVSLGAKKGQAWIERNKGLVDAPIMSHLGAVVNFIAGTVKRAPKLMQRLGFEWLWRIKEEPLLWKRYFLDAISFASLIIFKVIPLYVLIKRKCPIKDDRTGLIEFENNNDTVIIKLRGYFGWENIVSINQTYTDIIETTGNVEINIENNSYIDAAFIAKTMLLRHALEQSDRNLSIRTESRLISSILRYNCCDYLLN